MRERGKKIAFGVAWGRRALLALSCAMVFAVVGHPSVVDEQTWARAIGELIVAPASAHKSHKGSAAHKAMEAARKLHKLQQPLSVQHAAVQKKLQTIQSMVATHQKHVQHIQQLEAVQKKIQQLQLTGSAHKHLVATKFKSHHSKQEPSKQTAGKHYQSVFKHVMSKLTHHAAKSHTAASGHHHVVMHTAMAKLKGHHHASGHSGHGHYQVKQHAVFHHMLAKLSGYGKYRRQQPKQEPVVVVKAPTPAPKTVGVQLAALATGSDSSAAAPSLASKLTEVVAVVDSAKSSIVDSSMSKLGGPKQPTAENNPNGSKTKKDDNGADNDSGTAKQAGRGLGGRVVGALLPPAGSFRPNEVLAINLDLVSLAKAKQQNYEVIGHLPLPELGFTATRLRTPSGLDAAIGRANLQEALPADGFALNIIYTSHFRTMGGPPAAGGGITGAPSAPIPGNPLPNNGTNNGPNNGNAAGPGTGCAADRCFATGIIKWQPELGACARDIKIGVIDTGVDKNHPTFAGLKFEHESFLPAGSTRPSNQHGTAVFSLMAGNPRGATPGLVRDAKFVVIDAFFADQRGNAMSDTWTMLQALHALKEKRVDIANLSFAGPPDEMIYDALKQLARTGTVIVAAAGNGGRDARPSYPAAYQEVIAVTAVDRNLAAYMYAGRGKHIDVAAPGVDIWTALPNGRAGPQTGTSFAVPFVTSVIALSYPTRDHRTDGDPLAPKQRALALLQKDIKAIGPRGRDETFGVGLVQAPAQCDRGPMLVAKTEGKTDGAWTGTVQAESAKAPAAQNRAGQNAWTTSTVHSVANKQRAH